MISGVLVVDKPSGMTSHDVVNVVRRLARTRRVGHAGTLDPMATGVLVVLVGPATRLSQFAMRGNKRYYSVVRMGEITNTYDADGDITEHRTVTADRAAIEDALTAFVGPIEQIPPMYAAIKVKGRKLYELARQGKEIQRKPRAVTIHAIDVLDWQPPDLTLDILCSSGTYIRSLAHDLGQNLGCGGHIRELRRLVSGPFTIAQARPLAELEELYAEGDLAEALVPPQTALSLMPTAIMTPEQERALRYGQRIELQHSDTAESIQALDRQGNLIAVLTNVSDAQYRPTLVLPPSDG
ncbi:MAG: tRNA pseudouridine(55) synthase TruB [Anaerolineae bacterium]|nr:tRNA pseudouridine(55) synthase TruB [Anaerolineae bacterium]